jgi:putative periplasmic protein
LLRKILFFTLFFGLAFGEPNEISIDELKSIKPQTSSNTTAQNLAKPAQNSEISLDELKKIAPTDEQNLNIKDDDLKDEIRITDLILTTSKVPQTAYVNQIYKLSLKADIQQDITVDLNLTLNKTPSLKWLNEKKYSWFQTRGGLFETTLFFEANDTQAKLNDINVIMTRNGEFFQKASKKAPNPKFTPVPAKENYTHIVADELKVISHKTTDFDDKTNMMTIQLSVKNGDLSSFYIQNDQILRQNVSSINGPLENQRGFAFLIFDKNVTNVTFSYFNLQTQKFENFSLNVKIEKDDLSTQTDINPQESSFKTYKIIVIFTFVGVLIVMFLTSRNLTPLIIALVIVGAYFYFQKQTSTGFIAQNTQVKILPIKNSTIFYISKERENVKIFDEKADFVKIMLSDGKIGWVKKESIEK